MIKLNPYNFIIPSRFFSPYITYIALYMLYIMYIVFDIQQSIIVYEIMFYNHIIISLIVYSI